MNLLLEDFYLIRIAYYASTMAETDADIYDFMTLVIDSERTKDLDTLPEDTKVKMIAYRAELMMFAVMPPSCISDREFTWEEYSALKKAHQFLFVPDDHIETTFPVEAEIEQFLNTLRPFVEPQLKKSWEMATRESEFL